jgi:hypothetical protein
MALEASVVGRSRLAVEPFVEHLSRLAAIDGHFFAVDWIDGDIRSSIAQQRQRSSVALNWQRR